MRVKNAGSVAVPVVTAPGERLVLTPGWDVGGGGGSVGFAVQLREGGFLGGVMRPGVALVRTEIVHTAAIADCLSHVSLFCSSRGAISSRPAARSTMRKAVFALGGELMTPGPAPTSIVNDSGAYPAARALELAGSNTRWFDYLLIGCP